MNRFKFSEPTDKMPGAWHGSYTYFYERIFADIKYKGGTVLEIGVDGGGSLLAYRDWFEQSHVVGMDISPCPEVLKPLPRVTFIQGNAYCPEFVAKLSPASGTKPLLCAIDDGPHTLGTQQFFVEHYVPLLSEEGIAVVEDVQSVEHIQHLHAKLPPDFMGYAVDLRLADNRYDSLLFVIQRK